MSSSPLYFESHVTVEPVFDDRLALFEKVSRQHGFRVATLLLQRRKTDTPERSKNDAFCTGRSLTYQELHDRTLSIVRDLTELGIQVWRYKIEFTLLDSRYDDTALPLDRANLPEKERNPRPPV